MSTIRTGIGIDIHRLEKGESLILGGVEIPSQYGLLGHSDGDVLIHSIIDGLLGAANLGDIGRHFPSNKAEYKGISSQKLLEIALSRVVNEGWKPVFVDATIVAEKPLVAEFIPQMTFNIAHAINLPQRDISIKATTADGLGYIGRGEGISCQSIVTVQKPE